MKATEESRERERRMKKAAYDYCKAKGICVLCQKEEAFHNRVLCPSCMEKRAEQKARWTANLTQEKRDHVNAVKRERYHRYKDSGLCVNCGKPSNTGMTLCSRCRIQMRRASSEYRLRSGRNHCYEESGLCIFCGGERVEGRKLCAVCLEKNRKSMAYARQFCPTGVIGKERAKKNGG